MQFQPLDGWPGPMTKQRRRSTFKAPWQNTVKHLDRELAHLRARKVVLSGAFRAGQILRDGSRPAADATPTHPGMILSFEASIDGKFVPLKYPCDTFLDWQDNIRAIALALEALRTVDRYGVTKRAEQYRGWAQLPPPGGLVTPPPMTVEEAASFVARYADNDGRLMGSAEHFHAAYRRVAVLLHPDTGKGGAEWNTFQQAAAVLKKHHGA